MSSELHVDVSRGVAVLTLNRPAQQNAFTPTMAAELGAALQRCDAEDAIRAVIVTGTPPPDSRGAGERKELAPITAEAWAAIEEEATRTFKRHIAGRRVVDLSGPHGIDYS
ncbi:encapsulin, partial [Nocardia abscessus]|uniref:encapsulin n=1 Tax=Nocardia abscessus TaxID=120957 RepID=UPI002454D553